MTQKQYDFPTEVLDLPSQGKVYPIDHPLASGQITIKHMTAKEEDILSSQNLIKKGIVLDKLFESVIIDNVNIDYLAMNPNPNTIYFLKKYFSDMFPWYCLSANPSIFIYDEDKHIKLIKKFYDNFVL
jgi:hypothetical protein